MLSWQKGPLSYDGKKDHYGIMAKRTIILSWQKGPLCYHGKKDHYPIMAKGPLCYHGKKDQYVVMLMAKGPVMAKGLL